MLEGLVAGLLNRFLGMYVKNFDPTQLKVGIWSGDVKLRNLELRKEALDQLKLPINVVEGYLGELTLVIPWSNLRGAPVKIFIEDVFLLASPKEEAQYNEEEEERRKQRIKMEKLDSAELLKERSQEGLTQEEQKKSQSFTESLVAKIVDNLQVTVKNIHVRYEDSISAPGHPFALGVTLEEFSAVSTDGNWKPTFIQDSSTTTHKMATLGALSVYWNTDTKLYGSGRETDSTEQPPMHHDEMIKTFKAMIGNTDDNNGVHHQFILKPVSGQAKIEMDKSGDVHAPKWKANLLFDEIGLVLDDHQYRDALMMVDLFHYFIRHQEYKKYQPKGVTAKEDPRAWFRFAGDAVLRKIHDRNRRWSWEFFRERRDDRLRYIELFRKKKQNQPLSPEENEDLNKLEWKLDYEDLRFWRSLARNQLKKENAAALRNHPAKQEQQQQGWVAWMWGSKPAEQSTSADENTQMTEEQRQELYEAIDWDEKAALAESVETPRDALKFQVEASLSTGSFTLRQSPHENTKDLLSLHFDVFKAKALARPDSFLTDVSLGGLRVDDGTTPDSLFPEIVRVKDAPKTKKQRRLSIVELEETSDEAFFQLQLEQNPLDGQGDFAVKAKLKPLEIVWNPNIVVGVVDFFRPPDRHMESITALMESAGATVEDFRQQTRAGLEFALEEHKTINAMLDLQAPLIIIPESITTRKSTCMILDAGHISVNSELVDKDTMKEVQSKQRDAYTAEDFKRLESLMYDKFMVKLTSTQLLIGPSIEEAKAQLTNRNEELKMHIVEQINIDFLVQLSILPKAPNLAKLRVSGHLPLLHVAASDTKYKSLMKLIDVAVPKFGDETASEQEQAKRPRLPSNVSTRSSRSGLLRSPKQRRRGSSQLIPFVGTKEQAIVLDDIDEDDEAFEDADDGQSNNVQLKLKQKTFELKFTVDELRGSLYKSDPDGMKPDALLVELVAQNFEVNFFLRPFDMVADVSLGSVTVDDFVDQPPAEFKSIVSSGDIEDKKAHRALVKVNVVRVKKESPDFMSVYEGVETNVNMAITTINLVVTRKTLLTLLDFVLVTFTSPGGESQQQQKAVTDDGSEVDIAVEPAEPAPSTQAAAIRVKVDLKSIQLVLNNDGIRLATLSFNQADIGVFIFGSTMRINTKLGDLSLVDDVNMGVPEDSSLRKLITIQGDDLADFRYETFDSKNEKSYPGYDSSIYLRAGSIKVNFLEEPFRKIVDFMVKFGKMQAIYNAARQAAANQAQQLQQISSRIKLDVVINTPIVVFPSVVTPGLPKRDLITAYLGEIYAQNKFSPLDDSEYSDVAMKMSAGIRNIRLTSLFHYADEQSEELELIDHVDLGFNIVYAEHKQGAKRPELEIEGSMTEFNLKLTQYQMRALLAVSRSVPAAFSGDPEVQAEQAEQDVDSGTLKRARTMPQSQDTSQDDTVDMKPELGSNQAMWTKLDLAFKVPTVGLELISASESQPVGSLDHASLGRFSLDDSRLKTRIQSNGSLEAEFVIQSFTISDSRPGETNKFRRIMTSGNKSVQQFMASVTMTGGKDRSLIAMAAIDSPRIIFALDYLFALQSFVMTGLAVDESSPMDGEEMETPEESDADSMQISIARRESSIMSPTLPVRTKSPTKSDLKQPEESKMSISFRVNIVDAQVILIANPLSSSSEAIVLGTKQVLLSQQHALTFQVSEVGMFLCRMDRFEDSRLRIIDDFSVQLSMDSSQPDLTSLHIDIEPLILRLSLRDILLALQIISKASELSSNDDDKKDQNKPGAADQKAKELGKAGLKQRTASGKGPSTVVTKAKSGKQAVVPSEQQNARSGQPHDLAKKPKRREELSATIDGIRVVLIGDLHELPIMDLSIKNFTATAEDWSSSLKAEVPIEMYINVYNFSKSAWEPLLEPWAVGLGVAKEQETGLLSVDIASRKTFDVTITTNTIALASKSFDFLTQDEDVLAKPRGTESPYRIRNYTGFEAVVRSKNPNSEEDISVRLDDGQEAPWSFEHWEKMRENLLNDSMASTAVAVQLEGSGFDPLKNIRLNREGEFIYSLRPKRDDVTHRLMVDVKLGRDNVKYVTLRSPLLVENDTQIPVELGVFDAQEGDLLKIEKIAPGESRPAPVGAVYLKSLLVRPDSGFGYAWSTEALWWRDLLKRPTRTMVCKGENGDPFYFQMNAAFDRSNALTK
ncbi:Vacuolar protein sorting-associated protein 13 [Cytospora mali]|uniref:Vacuolar protein sorting-associated protein 13 n=1 Tax=Cytospora mali TaxID=578113 RepID=A0A194VUI3_CYTMA|nr:Vacuolar protein sorting-associated protein 13 [Valsa mali]